MSKLIIEWGFNMTSKHFAFQDRAEETIVVGVHVTKWRAWSCAAVAALASGLAMAAAENCAPSATQTTTLPVRVSAPGLRVGIALSGGSMHGLAHIGVIEELEARGLEVHVVAGTSVGALIGSLWASGLTGLEIEELGRRNNWQDAADFAASWEGLFTSGRLGEQLRSAFRGRPIESWPRRFGAVATDLGNGRRRILMSGDGARAVQASSAIPVLFTPIVINGERLADGGLVEPIPVGAARALGADYVIAVDVGYRPYEEAASGLVQYAFQSMHILINRLSEYELREADVAIRLDLHRQLMNCGGQALIAEGREAVRHAWPEISKSITLRAARQ